MNFLEEDVVEPWTCATVETLDGLGVGVCFDQLAKRAVEQPRVVQMTDVER